MTTFISRFALAACLVVSPYVVAAPAFAATAVADADQPGDAKQKEAQRKLTETDIAAFVAGAKEIEPLIAALPEDKRDDPDAATLARLEKAARAAGLKDYADYDEIAANVGFILHGFDRDTKTFVGPKALIQAEIAEVKADKSMSRRERADAVRELSDSLDDVDEVQYPENITLVAKRYDDLSAILKP